MHLKIVVAGLDPAIHVFLSALLGFQDVDARIKSGQSVRVRYSISHGRKFWTAVKPTRP